MAYCILCDNKLSFATRPVMGQGKLTDGNEICFNCFKKHGASKVKFKEMDTPQLKRHIGEDSTGEAENTPTKQSRLDEIKAQIKKLNLSSTSTFLGRKEIDELPQILSEDEIIDNITQGFYKSGQGILVSTNRRLVFIDKGLLYGVTVEDFPLDKITSIEYQTGLLLGEITIHTSGNHAKIEQVEKASTRSFAEFVRSKLSQPKETVSAAPAQPDVLDQLEKLAKLKENGILSEEEFAEQKKKLLEKL